ncbi:hypothetical protein EU527_18685 [Candidatus Thorarchaeota archaeon]|nr:MAG: hypothetical protein EU527_18685 [Candidatus Thorarchaeota archaeon]
MKRTLQVLLAMSFLAMFLTSPVAAATSQGLEWSVALDDEFTFAMVFVDEGEDTFNEGINVTIIEAPPTLSDPLDNWTHIGSFNLNITFYNGTSLGLYGFLFLGLMSVNGYFAVPTGNFSLLTNLIMAESMWNENFTLTDNTLFWGVTFSETDGDMEHTITAEYLKDDGFLSRYILEATNTSSSVSSSVSCIRDNLPALTTTTTTDTTGTGFDIVGFVTDNALYIGIGIIIILLLVIIVKKR